MNCCYISQHLDSTVTVWLLYSAFCICHLLLSTDKLVDTLKAELVSGSSRGSRGDVEVSGRRTDL